MTCVLGDDDVATHMDYCTFTCNNGYRMSGSHTRKCLTSYGHAKWTGYAARCKGTLINNFWLSTYSYAYRLFCVHLYVPLCVVESTLFTDVLYIQLKAGAGAGGDCD